MTVDSGYRNPAHNATLKNSSKQSQHMYGLAIDFGTGGNATAWSRPAASASKAPPATPPGCT
ncbi:MAG: D-Ala-D-Ala carboxypeptidase family metallohydrolase [Terriglobales bacterium]